MDVTDLLDIGSVFGPLILEFEDFEVYKGILRDGTTVAIMTRMEEGWKGDMHELLDIWIRCGHPNIVPLIGKATFRGNVAIVYEWHDYHCLEVYLSAHPGKLEDRCQLSTQICDGVTYLHTKDIIHGELGGGSILVSGGGVPRILLSGLTSSIISDANKDDVRSLYKAPEIGRPGAKHTFAGDVYALAMTILKILTENLPKNDGFDIFSVHEQLLRGELPPRPTNGIPVNDAGDMIWNILCKCWSLDPEGRPTSSEIYAVMCSVCKNLDSVALRSHRLVVRENTSVQDLVSHFVRRGLVDYTDSINSCNRRAIILVADTALANVYRVERTDHQPIALKRVKHKTPYKKLKRAARELDCWSLYSHENILPVFGFAVMEENLAMVSPWMSNGCVTEYVVNHLDCDRLILCIQLANATSYLHSNNVVHGDIKGPNVLVSDTGTVQVTDFGVSIADHLEIEFTTTSSGRGSHRWQAPEILRGQTDSTREADVYALGMTMIEIYTGEPPYGSRKWLEIMVPVITEQLRPGRPDPTKLPISDVGTGLWELMQHCWEARPSERPTSDRVRERLQYYASVRPNPQGLEDQMS